MITPRQLYNQLRQWFRRRTKTGSHGLGNFLLPRQMLAGFLHP
jgi:hypothetical protein